MAADCADVAVCKVVEFNAPFNPHLFPLYRLRAWQHTHQRNRFKRPGDATGCCRRVTGRTEDVIRYVCRMIG